ncbi:MAG: tryptophan--tRNA ligase [Candidatus Andersenbacteria bacterium]|nr:tryptophan--tRNA ligase [Candidatus Andersenbacteria bacterium]MBI3251241.1 tryptophan--tRNA ligase [Candidatus Andersenbacteria bacterium]
METPSGKTILSGIQPSGTLHIGNYLGALKQWVELQKDNTTYYCIVDLHAVTVPYNPKVFSERVLDAVAMYLACGVDPDKSVIFIQSNVSAHSELAWLLGTMTPFGELSRMTQFKDKAAKQKTSTSLGLFAYPVLMAADILLYKPDLVPVGEDQTQHVELTRNIAQRFNNTFGEVFTLPNAYIPKSTARIMSLTDASRKMSKSDGEKTYVALSDSPDIIRKKIMSAVTETEPVFSFEKSGPAVQNLLAIYEAMTNKDSATIEQELSGKGYKEFKEMLAEAVIEKVRPIREQYELLRKDDTELRIVLGRGAQRASQIANTTLHLVKEKMGLL